jgi:hypothetical protein
MTERTTPPVTAEERAEYERGMTIIEGFGRQPFIEIGLRDVQRLLDDSAERERLAARVEELEEAVSKDPEWVRAAVQACLDVDGLRALLAERDEELELERAAAEALQADRDALVTVVTRGLDEDWHKELHQDPSMREYCDPDHYAEHIGRIRAILGVDDD